MKPLRWISLWTPVIAFMIAAYVVSGQDVALLPERLWDKLIHVVLYCVFGLLCQRAFHGGRGPLRARPALLAWLLTVAYGAIDEWHQASVPGRFPSMVDWIADVVGGCVALVLAYLIATTGASTMMTDLPQSGAGPTIDED